jgi:hypothetical protein
MHEQQPNTEIYGYKKEDKVWDEKRLRKTVLTIFIPAMAQTQTATPVS